MTYPIDRYLSIQSAYGPTFAPDGRSLAFLTNITGRFQLWQVDLTGPPDVIPWPEQLTFAADRVLAASYAPRGRRLVYLHDVGGNENAQLCLLEWDDAGGVVETALSAGHESALHTFAGWAEDGRSFLFAANRRHPALFDLYRQPLAGPAERLWTNDGPGYLYPAEFSPDGGRVAFARISASFRHDLFELEVATGVIRQLNPPDRPARYQGLAYSADGRFLYLTTDLNHDFLHLARLELATGEIEPLLVREWDIELLTRSHDGLHLAYVVNEGGLGRPHLLDVASGAARAAPTIDDGAPGVAGPDYGLTFDGDDRQLAFTFSSATRSLDVFVWDLAAGVVRPVTASNHAGLPRRSFVAPELIRYPTFDGRQIPAWFYRPAKPSGPLPVVIMVHGGPEAQVRPIFNFLAQYFVAHGYAILAPNVRGSTGYGKAYSHLDDVHRRLDSVADLAQAVYWLHEDETVDDGRIAVYGGSYGGFMVLAALTNYPDLWAAGVDVVGISNFVSFLENTSDYRRAHRESEYGSLERDRAFLTSISPIHQVDQITAPLMVVHGANDPRVPLDEAQQVVDALRARDIPVEFLVFDDEGHGIVKLANKRIVYPAIVQFLKTHMAPPDS